MTEVTLTCKNCSSGIHIHPTESASMAICSVCQNENKISFDSNLIAGELINCPCCNRKDFYKQKDFNRKIGVILFVIAAILAIFTYGVSLIILYLFDLILYRKLAEVVICYKCNTLFRKLRNMDKFMTFNHEMNDRIVYADHDFGGKELSH